MTKPHKKQLQKPGDTGAAAAAAAVHKGNHLLMSAITVNLEC